MKLVRATQELGGSPSNPFTSLSFLVLPVDVERF